jgi:hypothetical protein
LREVLDGLAEDFGYDLDEEGQELDDEAPEVHRADGGSQPTDEDRGQGADEDQDQSQDESAKEPAAA